MGGAQNLRPDPLRSRLRSLALLLVLGTAVVATTLLVGLGRFLGALGTVAVVVAALALNTGVCVVAFRVTTTRALTVREVLPGAVAAAVIWQLLQWFGTSYVQHVVASASVTNSVFAVVLGLIAFLYLVSTVLLICAEVNVVHVDKLHPRALLTPFTDDVHLTEADRKMYEGQAKAQQAKGISTRRSDIRRTPVLSQAGTGAGRAPARDAPIPATTTNPIPINAAGPGTWCRITNPMISANAGSRLIIVPNADVVSRRRAKNSSERDEWDQDRQPEPDEDEVRGDPVEHHRAGHQGGDHTRRRHRHRQSVDTRDIVADPLGQQDVAGPAHRGRQGEQHTHQVHGSRPGLGQQQHTDCRQRRPHHATSGPAVATATPSGPRNSSALAVPSRMRPMAAMNSRVTRAVTTPSARQ